MTTLTVTARGQVTLHKKVLMHLGIRPGDKIRLDLSPDGRAELKADRAQDSWRAFQGFLKGKTSGARLSIQEINAVIAERNATADSVGSEDHR